MLHNNNLSSEEGQLNLRSPFTSGIHLIEHLYMLVVVSARPAVCLERAGRVLSGGLPLHMHKARTIFELGLVSNTCL